MYLDLRFIKEIVFRPSSEFFTGCLAKDALSVLCCQCLLTPFSLIQPLFICLIFIMCALHEDSSDSRTLCISHIKTKTFGHVALFPL